eukprot:GHVQ01043471.1.p1 GENE.GHVQ01043471.1~~GHVQ01043471.1.p1  ORF type:complete len:104 (-),score=13.71 GHVQ01043471.1:313-624(-)
MPPRVPSPVPPAVASLSFSGRPFTATPWLPSSCIPASAAALIGSTRCSCCEVYKLMQSPVLPARAALPILAKHGYTRSSHWHNRDSKASQKLQTYNLGGMETR